MFSLRLWMLVWVYLVQFQLFCCSGLLPYGWFFFQRIFISFYVLTHTFNFLILVLYECDLHFLFLLLSWEGFLSLRVDFFMGLLSSAPCPYVDKAGCDGGKGWLGCLSLIPVALPFPPCFLLSFTALFLAATHTFFMFWLSRSSPLPWSRFLEPHVLNSNQHFNIKHWVFPSEVIFSLLYWGCLCLVSFCHEVTSPSPNPPTPPRAWGGGWQALLNCGLFLYWGIIL